MRLYYLHCCYELFFSLKTDYVSRKLCKFENTWWSDKASNPSKYSKLQKHVAVLKFSFYHRHFTYKTICGIFSNSSIFRPWSTKPNRVLWTQSQATRSTPSTSRICCGRPSIRNNSSVCSSLKRNEFLSKSIVMC